MNEPAYTLEVHVEELCLHGFTPDDRHGLREAIERELAKLVLERGLPAVLTHSGTVPRLDGGVYAVAPGTAATATGTQVAQALYGTPR
jgi:hypothetical protein